MMVAKSLHYKSRLISIFLIFIIALGCLWFRVAPAIALSESPETMGAWETIPLPPQEERLQSVHTILLPNGKVLMANGSSFRSTVVKKNDEYEFMEGVDLTNYDVINNTGLYDPATGKFERIPSPPALLIDQETNRPTTNDLFCGGHIQLANGDVLFVGGTGQYYNGGAFTGSKWFNLYHWRTGKWSNPGQMKDGRW